MAIRSGKYDQFVTLADIIHDDTVFTEGSIVLEA